MDIKMINSTVKYLFIFISNDILPHSTYTFKKYKDVYIELISSKVRILQMF